MNTKWKAGIVRAAWVVGLVAILSSCATSKEVPDPDLTAASYGAADKLIEGSQYGLARDRNIVVATFVNINDLEDSSTLGRLIAEQVSSRLTQVGYRVVELKLRKNIFMKQRGGEFMLSRAVQDVAAAHNAQAVVAGVYAVARDKVFVKSAVIQPVSAMVMSAYDYELPIGRNMRALLYARR